MVSLYPHVSIMKSWKMAGYIVFFGRNVDPCLFMYNTMIFVVYVHDGLFWKCPQSDIDKFVNF